MPSSRVQEYLDGLTEEEIRERRDNYYRSHRQAARMGFMEFMEELAFEDQLFEFSFGDQPRDQRANHAANGLGGFDYIGNSIPYSRKARDHRYGSGPPHGHSAHRGTVGRYPEDYYGNEPFAGGGNGNHGARTQTWAPNPYGPAQSGPRFLTEDPADLGDVIMVTKPHHHLDVVKRLGVNVQPHSLHSLMLALVITEAGKIFARTISMGVMMIGMLTLGAQMVATGDDTMVRVVAISRV